MHSNYLPFLSVPSTILVSYLPTLTNQILMHKIRYPLFNLDLQSYFFHSKHTPLLSAMSSRHLLFCQSVEPPIKTLISISSRYLTSGRSSFSTLLSLFITSKTHSTCPNDKLICCDYIIMIFIKYSN